MTQDCADPPRSNSPWAGKDSIRYENTVDVDPRVFKNLQLFCEKDASGRGEWPCGAAAACLLPAEHRRPAICVAAGGGALGVAVLAGGRCARAPSSFHAASVFPSSIPSRRPPFHTPAAAKRPGDQLFESFDAQDLNVRLKELMEGLSVKVFRTYNASIVLDTLLSADADDGASVDAKKAAYDGANKEVAVLCNHQRAVPKGHVGQMEKLTAKMEGLQAELAALRSDLSRAEAGKPGEDGRKLNPEALAKRVAKKQEQIEKAEINFQLKENLKTVALGTSKINYLDPRITVAWCVTTWRGGGNGRPFTWTRWSC